MRLGGRAGTAKRHCSTRVDQYQVLGLAYGPQECTDADWRRPTLQTRPGIPGAGMPILVPGTGIPAYCGGCPRCGSFAALRTTTDVQVLRRAQDDNRRAGPSLRLRSGQALRSGRQTTATPAATPSAKSTETRT